MNAEELAHEVAVEIRRLDEERRRQLEDSYQGRMVKAEVSEDAE